MIKSTGLGSNPSSAHFPPFFSQKQNKQAKTYKQTKHKTLSELDGLFIGAVEKARQIESKYKT